MPDSYAPVRFGFVLIPGFSLLSFSCAVDVLRAARIEAPEAGFSWHLLSPYNQPYDGSGRIASSTGIELATESKEHSAGYDALIVCGGLRSHEFLGELKPSGLDVRLRDAARAGCIVGTLSDAAYLVAAAGLFDKTRSTIHWKCQSTYRELHPELDVRASVLEIDGKRVSCAGGTASLDLTLHLVARTLGWEAAGRIANNYVHDKMRGEEQMQHMSTGFQFVERSTALGNVIADMETNIEAPIPISKLAETHGIGTRQLDRLFKRYLRTSPSAYYRDLRLLRAAGLLRQSDLSVSEIALACGFNSASHMGRMFKSKFGKSPIGYQKEVVG